MTILQLEEWMESESGIILKVATTGEGHGLYPGAGE